MKNRITYRTENSIIVFRLGKTSNKKIAGSNEIILQSYSFSIHQLAYVQKSVKQGTKIEAKKFFDLADAVCFDCPFKTYGKCYTHKYMQFSGFVSMLKSIANEFAQVCHIPTLNEDIKTKIKDMSIGRFVRFGTYGEPTLIDLSLIDFICKYAKNWTGYTHQWMIKNEYSPYFMASVHNVFSASVADKKGFRSFIATENLINENLISCPASKEMNFVSNCSKCGLCSGTYGKGKKSVQILTH